MSELTLIPAPKGAYENIRQILEKARATAYRAVNFAMVTAYWEIGRVIVEEEQKGKERAKYGVHLIKQLSQKLTTEYGEGFTERNLWHIKNFYLMYPKVNALRSELSWTHYRLLLRVENEREIILQLGSYFARIRTRLWLSTLCLQRTRIYLLQNISYTSLAKKS